MDQEAKKPRKARFHVLAGLFVWSLLVAGSYVIWQVQNNAYWTNDANGKTGLKALTLGFLCVDLTVFILSYIIFRAWRNLPVSRRVWFWFGIISVAAGILWVSFLLWLNVQAGNAYSLPQALLLILLWSAVFLTGWLFLNSLWGFFRWLFSWRILKRFLAVFGALVILIVIFYAEENYRGQRAWNLYRDELEAKGEKLDFAEFIPPPVPDDQNFAMAPIVVSSYAGKLLHLRTDEGPTDVSISNRLRMTLERTPFIEHSNAVIGSWQLALPTNLKAWQEYYRTRFETNDYTSGMLPPPGRAGPPLNQVSPLTNEIIPLDTNEFPIAPEPQSAAADVLLALSRYKDTLDELQKASERPYLRFPINYQPKNPWEIYGPHWEALKQCAQILQLRAVAEVQSGQTEQSLVDVKLMLRLAESLHSEPLLQSQMVRINLVNLSIQPIWEGLAQKKWSKTELKELMQVLEKLDFVSDCRWAMKAERAKDIDFIAYLQKHRDESAIMLLVAICPEGLQSLYQLERSLPSMPSSVDQLIDTLEKQLPEDVVIRSISQLPPTGWYDQNRLNIGKFFQEHLFRLAKPDRHLIERLSKDDHEELLYLDYPQDKVNPYNFFANMLLGFMPRSIERFGRVQNSVDMALLACGLERYDLAHGEYPASLNDLTPEFLKSIPPDVVNGTPLHYRLTRDSRFQLYSVGWNGKDDGGMIELNKQGRLNPQLGDWAWQYPAKP